MDEEKAAATKPKKRNKKSCCAPNCLSGTVECTESVIFHGFPPNESRRKIWIESIPRHDWTPPKEPRLCNKHFTKDSYKTKRIDGNKSRILKIGS